MRNKVIYQEEQLSDVMKYFAKGYQQQVNDYEYFIDTTKGVVVFKMWVEDSE